MNKYNARKAYLDGYTFDSQAELSRYLELKVMERNGDISDLKVHPVFVLLAPFTYHEKGVRGITYEADFSYWEHFKTAEDARSHGATALNIEVSEDVKGVETEAFKLKAKLFKHSYPFIYFRIIN